MNIVVKPDCYPDGMILRWVGKRGPNLECKRDGVTWRVNPQHVSHVCDKDNQVALTRTSLAAFAVIEWLAASDIEAGFKFKFDMQWYEVVVSDSDSQTALSLLVGHKVNVMTGEITPKPPCRRIKRRKIKRRKRHITGDAI